MAPSTPDTLLKLASELTEIGKALGSTGSRLEAVASTLAEEAANVAAENAKAWGVDVKVAVRAGPWGAIGVNAEGKEVSVKK